MRRTWLVLVAVVLVIGAALFLAVWHPKAREAAVLIENELLWRNPSRIVELEAVLAECGPVDYDDPTDVIAMIVQDRPDPCGRGDRLPELLRQFPVDSIEPRARRVLDRTRPSNTAIRRLASGLIRSGEPTSEVIRDLLDRPEIAPHVRYEIWRALHEAGPSDLEQLRHDSNALHGISRWHLVYDVDNGEPDAIATFVEVIPTLEWQRELQSREHPHAELERAFDERLAAMVGITPAEIAEQIQRINQGLPLRSLPPSWLGPLRRADAGTCNEAASADCRALLVALYSDLPPVDPTRGPDAVAPSAAAGDSLWPEFGAGLLSERAVGRIADWILQDDDQLGRARRLLASVNHRRSRFDLASSHSGQGGAPILALRYGGATPASTAAAAAELATRTGVELTLYLSADGLVLETAAGTAYTGPCGPGGGPFDLGTRIDDPLDLARAEGAAYALRRGDIERAVALVETIDEPLEGGDALHATVMLVANDQADGKEHTAGIRALAAWYLLADGQPERARELLPASSDGMDTAQTDVWAASMRALAEDAPPMGPRSGGEHTTSRWCPPPLSVVPSPTATIPSIDADPGQ